jgi:hypothetical protein
MAAATAVTSRMGNDQFRGMFSDTWVVTATLDTDNLADAAGVSDTVAVPGVALGDIVLGFSFGVNLSGMTVTAYVSAANSVVIRVQNESGGAINLASTTIRLVIVRMV